MDHIYLGQLYLFIMSTMALFRDIKPMGDFSHWFDAQEQCYGQGLTIEENTSEQPYWTGVYHRLTPWINILGCYSDSIEMKPDFVKKTMTIRSVGMCQEMCFHENANKFAVKLNTCLCIERDVHVNPSLKLSPDACKYECENESDDIFLGECGGEHAYNIFEIQGVEFHELERCLSLQCSSQDTRFIPQECSEYLANICENGSNGQASSWKIAMENCKISHPPNYLLGTVSLENPHHDCNSFQHQSLLVWVGVARQVYTGIDQGLAIDKEEWDTFLECQMCEQSKCVFRPCTDLAASSIFCKNKSDTSLSQIMDTSTTSQENVPTSSSMSNNSTTKDLFAATSTTKHYDEEQLTSNNDMQHSSSTTDELALKISLPVTIVFIISVLCAMTLVFYRRKKKITKTERTKKEEVDSVRKTSVHSENNYIQDDSYFVLEQCSQKISKGSDSVNESPYNESEEGVYDHLRYKQVRKPEVEDTYQHASAGVSTDLSEYDTMVNARDKKQEEESSYDYTHTDKNKNYRTDLRAHNHLTDSPYDVAV